MLPLMTDKLTNLNLLMKSKKGSEEMNSKYTEPIESIGVGQELA